MRKASKKSMKAQHNFCNCASCGSYAIALQVALCPPLQLGYLQWRTQKVSEGKAKVLSRSCDVTNQLGECRRHDHYRVVREHAPKKFCKITPKNTHFRTGQIGSFSKTKKAFAQWWIFKFRGPRQEFPKIDVL